MSNFETIKIQRLVNSLKKNGIQYMDVSPDGESVNLFQKNDLLWGVYAENEDYILFWDDGNIIVRNIMKKTLKGMLYTIKNLYKGK